MRSQDEIQRAHDALIAVLLDEVPAPAAPDVKRILEAQTDVLAWVLENDEQSKFGGNMARLNAALEKLGFVLTRKEAAH